jgi:hypothetical protein
LLFNNFKSACGADFGTLTAVFANRNSVRALKFGLDNGFETSAYKTENAFACNFFTGAHTKVTEYALALITLD